MASTHQIPLISIAGAALLTIATAARASAHPHQDDTDNDHGHPPEWVHENGIGPDPDSDDNPATDTRIIPFITDAADAADDPPYAVITFEPPPGEHGKIIKQDYEADLGVTFGEGLSWQVCDRQRQFEFETMCTYFAPTSGRYAAGYLDHLNAPLTIEFERPVCIVTMSIYPTGGKEGEPFEFEIEGWTEAGEKLTTASAEFEWTNDTIRWRNMAGAYFVDQRAKKITVSMRSKDPAEAKKTLRYLMDDFAFIDDGCEAALESIEKRTGVDLEAAAAQTETDALDAETDLTP